MFTFPGSTPGVESIPFPSPETVEFAMTAQRPDQFTPPPATQSEQLTSFDPSTVARSDWAILAAGVLALFCSFFDYYTFSYSGLGYSASVSLSAWHGIFGWLGALAAFGGAAVLAAQLFGRLPATLPLPAPQLILGGFGIGVLCVLAAFFVHPGAGYDGGGFHAGHGSGYWLSLVAIVSGLVLSYRRSASAS